MWFFRKSADLSVQVCEVSRRFTALPRRTARVRRSGRGRYIVPSGAAKPRVGGCGGLLGHVNCPAKDYGFVMGLAKIMGLVVDNQAHLG